MTAKSDKTPTTLSIATEQMGRGWLKKLIERTPFKRSYLHDAIKFQRVDAPIWDAVEELKKEHQATLKKNSSKIKKLFPQPEQQTA